MSNVYRINLLENRLTSGVAAGVLRLEGLDGLALAELTYHADDAGHAASFSIQEDSPSASMVWAASYVLPFGKTKFDRAMEFYTSQRKKSAKLPDGPRFDASML